MNTSDSKTVFTITRQFDLPRTTVWLAWSEAKQLQNWWGPKGCTLQVLRFEFRTGGFFHYAMHFEDTPTMWGRFNYREIAELERMEWLNSFANDNCGIVRAPFSENCPLEIQNTVTFTENVKTTTVTLCAVPFGESPAERKYFEDLHPSLEQGYGGTFDQLSDHLAKSRNQK